MPRRLTFLVAGAGGALLLYGGLALTLPLGVMLLLVVLGGVLAGPIVPLTFSLVQMTTPTELYGRVFGALQSLSAAAASFAIATIGFVIEGAGLVPTIVALGAIYVAVTLGMLLNPALRGMDSGRIQSDTPMAATATSS